MISPSTFADLCERMLRLCRLTEGESVILPGDVPLSPGLRINPAP